MTIHEQERLGMVTLQAGEVSLPMRLARILVAVAALWASTVGLARADDFGSKDVAMWEYVEWQLVAGGVSGNPFDAVATVVFTHETDPGANHTTEMFYVSGDTWEFRFTGTKLGSWRFITQSSIPELDGHSGAVTVAANLDPTVKGFLTNVGNKFAIQTGSDAQLRGFLFNVFQHQDQDESGARIRDSGITLADSAFMNAYLTEAENNGFNVIFFLVMDPLVWTDGEDPRLSTFDSVEFAITEAHKRGQIVHFWLWGDADRAYVPPGGKLSLQDKRVLRYIAARLGPLAGWTMGYGFDLQEWTTESEMAEWADFLNGKFGWDHLIWARGRFNSSLDVNSYSLTSHPYNDALGNVQSDSTRPHHFGERDHYPDRVGESFTRQHMWLYAMAGGHGGHWGYKGNENIGSWTYPNADELKTHFAFWHTNGRFLLDMQPANQLISSGYALASDSGRNFVFFAEGVDRIDYDLMGMTGDQPVIAVDTRTAYAEIDLGTRSPANHTFDAPYSSDWAIAVGEFETSSSPAQRSKPPTELRAE